jgi:hypothetical protein
MTNHAVPKSDLRTSKLMDGVRLGRQEPESLRRLVQDQGLTIQEDAMNAMH